MDFYHSPSSVSKDTPAHAKAVDSVLRHGQPVLVDLRGRGPVAGTYIDHQTTPDGPTFAKVALDDGSTIEVTLDCVQRLCNLKPLAAHIARQSPKPFDAPCDCGDDLCLGWQSVEYKQKADNFGSMTDAEMIRPTNPYEDSK